MFFSMALILHFSAFCIAPWPKDELKPRVNRNSINPGDDEFDITKLHLPDPRTYHPQYDPTEAPDSDMACSNYLNEHFIDTASEYWWRDAVAKRRWPVESCFATGLKKRRVECEFYCRLIPTAPQTVGPRRMEYEIMMIANPLQLETVDVKKAEVLASGYADGAVTPKCFRDSLLQYMSFDAEGHFMQDQCLESDIIGQGITKVDAWVSTSDDDGEYEPARKKSKRYDFRHMSVKFDGKAVSLPPPEKDEAHAHLNLPPSPTARRVKVCGMPSQDGKLVLKLRLSQ